VEARVNRQIAIVVARKEELEFADAIVSNFHRHGLSWINDSDWNVFLTKCIARARHKEGDCREQDGYPHSSPPYRPLDVGHLRSASSP
jgi:hypothetical protein